MSIVKETILKEIDFLQTEFGITFNDHGMPVIRSVIKPSVVLETIRFIRSIWLDRATIISAERAIIANGNPTALVWDGPQPLRTLNVIPRIALYNERILIIDPIVYYSFTDGENSPIRRPNAWTEQFGKYALYLNSLRDWIADDYILLIPPPAIWNPNLHNRYNQLLDKKNTDPRIREKVSRVVDLYEEDVTLELLLDRQPDEREFMLQWIKNDKPDLFEQIVDKAKALPDQPDWFKIPFDPVNRNQLQIDGSSLSPLETEFLLNNWNLYLSTSRPAYFIEESLLQRRKREFSIDRCLRQIPMEFPNRIPLQLIYEFRKNGRLEGFRSYLMERFNELAFSGSEGPYGLIDEVTQGILSELKKYKDEWDDIKGFTLREMGKYALNNSVEGTEFVMGHMELVFFIMKLAVSASGPVLKGGRKLRKLKRHPLYVLHRVTDRKIF